MALTKRKQKSQEGKPFAGLWSLLSSDDDWAKNEDETFQRALKASLRDEEVAKKMGLLNPSLLEDYDPHAGEAEGAAAHREDYENWSPEIIGPGGKDRGRQTALEIEEIEGPERKRLKELYTKKFTDASKRAPLKESGDPSTWDNVVKWGGDVWDQGKDWLAGEGGALKHQAGAEAAYNWEEETPLEILKKGGTVDPKLALAAEEKREPWEQYVASTKLPGSLNLDEISDKLSVIARNKRSPTRTTMDKVRDGGRPPKGLVSLVPPKDEELAQHQNAYTGDGSSVIDDMLVAGDGETGRKRKIYDPDDPFFAGGRMPPKTETASYFDDDDTDLYDSSQDENISTDSTGGFADSFSSKGGKISPMQKYGAGLIRDLFAEKDQPQSVQTATSRVTPGRTFDMSSLLASKRPKRERYRSKGLLTS